MIYKAQEFTLKNGLKVTLKSPEVSDAQKLLNFIVSVASITDYILSTPKDFEGFLKDITKEEKYIDSYKENKDYLICVYHDGEIIGDCSLAFHRHEKDAHRATVGIAVGKEYWGLGIGSLLFEEMIKLAKNEPGIEQIELSVIANNERAKRLYTKKGFVKVGDIPHQLKLKDGSYLDGENMVLFLNK